VTLIGVAYAVAAFPVLSAAFADGDRRGFLRRLGSTAISITVLTVGAALGLVVLGELVIRTLFGGGAFGADDVALTAAVLSAFALSVPLESLAHLLNRAIFATHNTLLQVLASLASLGVTVVATLLLLPSVEILAIPLGFTIGQVAKVVLLGLALAVRLRAWDRREGAAPGVA
jgi:putative peptidoglycan lipid II flippase